MCVCVCECVCVCVRVRACMHSHMCYPSNIKHVTVRNRRHVTHKNQSTDTMRLMSSAGSPTDVSTMIIVTRPALGIAAAPILAQVAVRLEHSNSNHSNTDVSNSTTAPILLLTIDHASLLTSNSCVNGSDSLFTKFYNGESVSKVVRIQI